MCGEMKLITVGVALCLFSVCLGAYKKESEDDPVHYKFEYAVHDPQTKDIKAHWEHRDGHIVKGEYMMKESDGTVRVVQYSADPDAGFQATVKREGPARHPAQYGHQDHGHGEKAFGHNGITRYGDHH